MSKKAIELKPLISGNNFEDHKLVVRRAVLAEDLATLRFLLQEMDVNEPLDAAGFTALHHAAANNSIFTALLLLRLGASTKTTSSEGTPIDVALVGGHKTLCDTLSTYPGKPLYVLNNQLFIALYERRADAATDLVARKADINQEINGKGMSALHYAAINDMVEGVQFLLALKALVDAPTEWNATPLIFAVVGESIGSARLLIDAKADVNQRDNYKFRPIHYAARNKRGGGGTLASLLEAKAMPDQLRGDYNSPLLSAVFGSNLECARLLLAHGARVNQITLFGGIALHVAVTKPEYMPILTKLVAAKSSVNKVDRHGLTPLDYSIDSRQPPAVRFLLSARASVNQPGDDRCTAFSRAVVRGHIPILKALIEAKAGVNQNIGGYIETYRLWSHDGGATFYVYKSPLDISKDLGVTFLLLKHGAKSGRRVTEEKSRAWDRRHNGSVVEVRDLDYFRP